MIRHAPHRDWVVESDDVARTLAFHVALHGPSVVRAHHDATADVAVVEVMSARGGTSRIAIVRDDHPADLDAEEMISPNDLRGESTPALGLSAADVVARCAAVVAAGASVEWMGHDAAGEVWYALVRDPDRHRWAIERSAVSR